MLQFVNYIIQTLEPESKLYNNRSYIMTTKRVETINFFLELITKKIDFF
jgi:hypothetical protein